MRHVWYVVVVALGTALLGARGPVVSAAAQSTPAASAEEPSAAADTDPRYRDHLLIVGSSLMQEFLTPKVLEEMSRHYLMAPTELDPTGTAAGIEWFCAGVGVEFPDIVAATRKIRSSEFKACQRNGINRILEVKVGVQPIMVVTRKGDPVFNVSPRMFYLALAETLPGQPHFKENISVTWNDVDPDAPAVEISVILPDSSSGSRDIFDDFFLQAGCRHYPGIDTIYAASERVPKCIRLRKGPQVIEIPEPYLENLMDAFDLSPPGTLAVVGELAYLRYQDQLEYLPINGVLPTRENFSSFKYEMITFPRYYVKRAHMRNRRGDGVVRGLMEFMRTLASEKFVGPDGVFDRVGLNPLILDERKAARNAVRRLKTIGP